MAPNGRGTVGTVSRRYLRPGVLVGHVLVLLAALICLRLGWWQWNVAHDTRGTVQNLGYAFLWPVFSGAFIYMWLRFLHLEEVRERALTAELASGLDSAVTDGETGPPNLRGLETGSAGSDLDAPSGIANDTVGAVPAATDGASGADDVVAGTRADPDAEPGGADDDAGPPRRRGGHRAHPTAVTIAVATVADDDEDDPELAEYNRALARLAEQDRRRAR